MSVNSLYAAAVHCRDEYFSDQSCTVSELAEIIRTKYAALIEELAASFGIREVRRIARQVLLHDTLEDLNQPEIPGLGIPRRLVVRDKRGAEARYVPILRATIKDLEAGLKERDLNIDNARVKRARLQDFCDRMFPFMKGKPRMTVAAALRLEAKRKKKAA